jgi:hypothetical protein
MTSIPIAVDVALHRDYIDVVTCVKVLDEVGVAIGKPFDEGLGCGDGGSVEVDAPGTTAVFNHLLHSQLLLSWRILVAY